MTATKTIHAFTNDVLGEHDAVGIAELIRNKEITSVEATEAAIARAETVNGALNAIQVKDFERALETAKKVKSSNSSAGTFNGVPTFIKDNTDVVGLPTNHGSAAVNSAPKTEDGDFAKQFLAQGFVNLGKSTLPEFGLTAVTEPAHAPPTNNPWNTDYSCGASSGGSAVMVASGVVPVAHANDGGGSIRIPAACCGLVGLKPSRGRMVDSKQARDLPVNLVGEGIVSRSVRDTAYFFADAEKYYKNPQLNGVGLVTSASTRRLKIGYITDSITDSPTDGPTRQSLEETVQLLESMGHTVQPMEVPIGTQFIEDFKLYWSLLGFSLHRFGHKVVDPSFENDKVDNLTKGLSALFTRNVHRIPFVLHRLKKSYHDYAAAFADVDIMLSPVLAHTTPKHGYLHPDQDFDVLMDKLMRYVSFTPINNASGGPAISLPMGYTDTNLPISMQFSANHGDERTLIELAYEIEEAKPWRMINS